MRCPSPRALWLALGTLALVACGEEPTTTQTDTTAEPAPAAPLAEALTPNTWTLKAAPGDGAFVNQASAGVMPDANGNPVVYMLGGRDDASGTGAGVLTYRIATNTWEPHWASDPQVDAFNTNGVGRIGNLLYVSGGENFNNGFLAIVGGFLAYNPATNTFTEKAHPPKSTSQGVTGVIDGKLYVLPGMCSIYFIGPWECEVEPFRRLFRYNPATNQWATKKQAPHVHQLGAGGVINGKFYVAGGRGSNVLDRYDPATDSWTTLAPIPVGGGSEGDVRGTVLQGKLFVVSSHYNQNLGRYLFDAFSYNPATNVWTRKARPTYTHSDIVAITWNGKPYLLAVGGIHGPGLRSNPVELYTP